MPPVPAFYAKPESIDDIVEHSVGRALDLFDTVLQRCQAQGLVVLPLRSGGTGSPTQPRRNGLLLGFASLAAPTLRVASGKLARALDG